MPSALIALRVSPAQWLPEPARRRLLHTLADLPGAIDEIALFSSVTHAPLPLAEIEGRMRHARAVMTELRSAGYGAGINVLTTIGHHEEDLAHSLQANWPHLEDPDGRFCRGAYCPNSPQLRDYVRTQYELVAGAGPDFIWVDDDVRLWGHAPVTATCFCATCIARFNAANGTRHNRESLVAALRETAGLPLGLRARWLEHNRTTIAELLKLIADTVTRVAPEIQLGFMSGERPYEGYGFSRWAEALGGGVDGVGGTGRVRAVRWRPGGGFYADDAPLGLLDKAHEIGRQVAALPVDVELIQAEIENFPYQPLRKSAAITALECGAYIAAGARGAALNVLTLGSEPIDEFVPYLKAVAAHRPFFSRLVDAIDGAPPAGVGIAWNADLFAVNEPGRDWFSHQPGWQAMRRAHVLAELGLPLAYDPTHASVHVLTGRTAFAFERPELERLLSGGVLLDAGALAALHELGLGDLTGVSPGEPRSADTLEQFTDHPLNGSFAGWLRDARQSFWREPAVRLRPSAEGVQVLSRLVDYAGDELGCGLAVFENALGGRVAVCGYAPWHLIHSGAKIAQLRSLFLWLSRDRLPAVVESTQRVALWARLAPQGGSSHRAGVQAATFLNASWDACDPLRIALRSQETHWAWLRWDGSHARLKAEPLPDREGWVRLAIPVVEPWSLGLLTPG